MKFTLSLLVGFLTIGSVSSAVLNPSSSQSLSKSSSTSTQLPSLQIDSRFVVKIRDASLGALYRIEGSSDLLTWTAAGPVIEVREQNFVAPLPFGNDAYRFFRYAQFVPEAVVSLSVESPEFKLASGGTVGVRASVFKLRMSGEAGFLERLGLRLSSGSGQSIVYVSVWEGSEKVGETVFTGNRRTALATLTRLVLLPKGQDKSITVKIDLACVGAACGGIPGDIIRIDHNDGSDPLLQTRIIGASSGRTVPLKGETHSAGVQLMKSFPIIALDPLPANGAADGRLLRYKVTADSRGPVSTAKFTILFDASNSFVTNVTLYGFTDSSYSQPVSGFGSGGKLDSQDISSEPVGGFVPAVRSYVPLYCRRLDGTKAAVTVPADSTYYFEIRGGFVPRPTTANGTGVTVTPPTVIFTLLGDSTPPSRPLLNVGVVEDQGKNLIWSPNSYGQSVLTDADWTSGYAVPGLPPVGITQLRTN